VNLENNVDSEETDIVEVLDLVVLPFTGINTPFMLTGAIMLLGTGLTLVLVSRRREFEI
jgi:LPXTG-motif cell wall-anchored protein